MEYPSLADHLFRGPPLRVLKCCTFLKTFEITHFASQGPPPATSGHPLGSNTLLRRAGSVMSSRSMLANAFRICPPTFRTVHSGVEEDWRPDTRAEHTGNYQTCRAPLRPDVALHASERARRPEFPWIQWLRVG